MNGVNRVAVTGSAGQLGGELCALLGPRAVPVPRAQMDVADREAVLGVITRLSPDLVINAAAYVAVDRAETDREACHATNVTGAENLVEACRQLGVPLVQISTDYVFGAGADSDVPYAEDDPTGPLNVYGETKLTAEQVVASYEPHLIVRTCGLYARPEVPRQQSFPSRILALAAAAEPLRIVDDQWCTPSYVPHVARAVLFLAGLYDADQSAPWGTYHVTNAGQTTAFRFARHLIRGAGLDVPVEPVTSAAYGAAAQRPAYSVLDTGRYEALDGPPMPSWSEAADEFLSARAGVAD